MKLLHPHTSDRPAVLPEAAQLGTLIRDLRRQAHITQAELAAAVGIQQGPLSNIETGRNFPSTPVLMRLAWALNISIDALLDPMRAGEAWQSATPSLAPAATMPATLCGLPGLHPTRTTPPLHLETPLATLISRLARDYLALEDLCGVPRQARLPLDFSFERSVAAMPRLARQLRTHLGVGSAVVFDYLELFENHGLRIIFAPLPAGVESLSLYDARHANLFIFITTPLNPERQLFRLLYELGQVLLYLRAIRLEHDPAHDPEVTDKMARRFAAEVLMPEEVVSVSVAQIGVQPHTWDLPLLLRLKHRFGVSAESFNYRLLELGLITPELQDSLRQTIKAHYAKTDFAEPGRSRRILSPNGRLGDLLHVALQQGHPEAGEIARRFKKIKMEVE